MPPNKTYARVNLKKGREYSVLSGHPWVFSGAIAGIEGDVEPGSTVIIRDHLRNFLAWGYINPLSQIAVRILSWHQETIPGVELIRRRVRSSIQERLKYFEAGATNAYRLINSEGDLLPGLTVDRYADTLVLQIQTAGMERYRKEILDEVQDYLAPKAIYEKSDSLMRKKEGLETRNGVILGKGTWHVEILENGHRFLVDLKTGQKTGFYLDQRENRLEIQRYSPGAKVLNCFSYTGGFSVYALRAGALGVTNVEFSPSAMEVLRKNTSLNNLDEKDQEDITGDAFEVLRDMRQQGRSFDLIVLDPPKFAQSQAQLKNAIKGYKDINLQAMHLIRPGGILFTFSCSGAVSPELFLRIINWAGMDAKRSVQVLKRLGQPWDHPFLAAFPESEYLKGLIIRVH